MKTCTECKQYPVRQANKDLCRKCFDIALRDLLREEKPCEQSNNTKE